MMRLIGIVFASAVLFGSVPAKADFLPNLDGWYIEGRGGVPLEPHAEARVEGAGFNGEYDEDDGIAIAVAAGAYFAPNWRGELEFGWTHGEDGTFFISSAAPVPHTGEVDVYSGLINVFHELPIQNEIWRPYFGAGIGIAVFDFDRLGGGAFFTEGSEVTFNGALHAGIDFSDQRDLHLHHKADRGHHFQGDFRHRDSRRRARGSQRGQGHAILRVLQRRHQNHARWPYAVATRGE